MKKIFSTSIIRRDLKNNVIDIYLGKDYESLYSFYAELTTGMGAKQQS